MPNCKLGDLAMVWRAVAPHEAWAIGAIRKLVDSTRIGGRPVWKFDTPLIAPGGMLMNYAIDEILKPLPDLPDDEGADTGSDLPVKVNEVEHV